MNFTETPIEGLVIVEPRVFTDSRGCFFESFSLREFRRATGLHYIDFVQDNESHSSRGVIRGLHFQRGEHAQAKLVRVTTGAVLDVAVDLRDGSPTYGRHFAVELSAENKRQLFIPRGFAHGFSVLSDEAVLQYKVDNYYCPEAEDGISPSDPTLAIDWRIDPATAILSPKDLALPLFGN
ncbi:MAG: dTDP-4-dehydrorhamnose 3,5-epimerase [Muribaculaceae bacterium]|nr:dTDP-4-dehydrorhamnose 3,5-epimerase [Muribaculaceae bacterium]MDE6315514.1 dTDP-4-dehydrorhamnose 3,5-epimerase [Muribaculaceae bacterium]